MVLFADGKGTFFQKNSITYLRCYIGERNTILEKIIISRFLRLKKLTIKYQRYLFRYHFKYDFWTKGNFLVNFAFIFFLNKNRLFGMFSEQKGTPKASKKVPTAKY